MLRESLPVYGVSLRWVDVCRLRRRLVLARLLLPLIEDVVGEADGQPNNLRCFVLNGSI
nr:hypothetical protein [Nitrosomonas nitrosa]